MRLNATFTQNTGRFPASFGEIKEIKEGYSQEEVDKMVVEGVEAGKKAQYDAFWDVFQQNGSNKYNQVQGVFNGKRFTAANFFPKYDIKPIGDAQYLFYAWEATAGLEHTILDLKQRLEDCGVVLDTSQATNMTRAFSYCFFIDNIPTLDCTGLTGGSHIFASSGIARIEKVIINETTSFASWFTSTRSLTEIRFDGVIGNSIAFGDCSLLSTASVQSVIDHLKDLTGGTAQTLTLHADVGGKLTDQQKAAITAKNWTLVY